MKMTLARFTKRETDSGMRLVKEGNEYALNFKSGQVLSGKASTATIAAGKIGGGG